jgi:hypothetical protein
MKPNFPLFANDAQSGIIMAANAHDIEACLRAGNVLTAANDANLSGFLLSQPLTEFIVGAGAEDREQLQPLLDRVAPFTPAPDSFMYLVEDDTQAGISPAAVEMKRAIGGDFTVDTPKGTQAAGILDHYGLSMWIDVRQGGMNPRVQQRYAMILKNRLLRGMIEEALTLLSNAATADSASNWNASGADPDSDVDDMVDASGDASGANANRVLYGGGAWMKRRRSYRKEARTNGGELGRLTPEELALAMGLDDVVLVGARKRSSASALTKILNNTVIAYDASEGLLPTDSSNIKRFGETGEFQVFVNTSSPVRTLVTVHTKALLKITRTTGIRKRAVTFT